MGEFTVIVTVVTSKRIEMLVGGVILAVNMWFITEESCALSLELLKRWGESNYRVTKVTLHGPLSKTLILLKWDWPRNQPTVHYFG